MSPPRAGRLRRLFVACAAVACVLIAAALLAELTYRGYFMAKDRLPELLTPEGTFDIYAVGDSTMAGKPYAPGLSIPLLVDKMLGGSVKGRKIRLHLVARQGDSAGPQLLALSREVRFRDPRRPGVVIVYQGHNDAWQDPAGDPGPQTTAERLKDRLLPDLLTADELLSAMERARWLPLRRTIGTYEYNLRRILELSRERGLTPILATSIGNVCDIEPGLWPSPEYPAQRLRALLEPGLALEAAGHWEAAERYYGGLLGKHPPLQSTLYYRIGKCREGLGDFAGARRSYWDAIDSDSSDSFRRATRAQNDLVRRLAAEYSVPLVDSVALFEAASPHGLVGDALFADGHHPNIRGVLLLSRAYAQTIADRFGASLTDPIADPAAAFTAFDYGKDKQEEALLDSGGWLLYVARGHVYPRQRLALARERFQAAIALDPDRFESRFGLAFAQAAAPDNPARREEDIAWLSQNILESNRGDGDQAALNQAVAQRLRKDGVPEEDVREFLRVASPRRNGWGPG